MWFKKIFKQQKMQVQVRQQVQQMQQQDTIKQSKIYTVSQQQLDLRYSNIKIINTKSIHLPLNEIHFIESILFESKKQLQCKNRYDDELILLDEFIITDRQILIIPDIFNRRNIKNINPANILHIYYGIIERIEIIELKKQIPKLQFILKDSRSFIIQYVVTDKLKQIQKLIRQFGFPNGINKFYAFKYGKVQKKYNGWKIYDFDKEIKRQGIQDYLYKPNLQNKPKSLHAYQLLDNKYFELSPTYPKKLIVPIDLTQSEIIACSKFRTKQRLPILTYFYQYQPGMFSTLFRCSQIKSGILSNRCVQDQKMIKQISIAASNISKQKKKQQRINCKIFDARGFYAALGNKLSGKGFQQVQNYPCQFQFLNIPNIHAVRDCYNKIKGKNPNKQFIQILGESGWIDYLYLILSGAKSMVKSLIKGTNVIVHCSDGWDRTTQLSALTQLLIDPYYRTLQGFIVLIEKDWRECGHKFRERSGQYNAIDYHAKEISPVFIQFLDCVVQIMNQFPLSFEFNMRLLSFIGIAYQSYTYGTFLSNNCKQSSSLNLEQKTISVWSDILEYKQKYLNKFYIKNGPKILQISIDSKDSTIWSQFLLQQISSKGQQWNILQRQLQINNNLRQNIINYDRQIELLRQKLKK